MCDMRLPESSDMSLAAAARTLESYDAKQVHLRDFYQQAYGYDQTLARRLVTSSPSRRSRSHRAGGLLRGGPCVLDVGCGSGEFLRYVSGKYDLLVGLDVAPGILRTCAEVVPGVQAVLADLNCAPLPFVDECFDAVTMLVVLEYVADAASVLREVRRVMKVDGQLVLSVGNIVSLRNRSRAVRGIAPYTSSFMGRVNGGALCSYGVRELKLLMASSGLKVDRVVSSGRLAGLRSTWPSLLGDDLVICARRTG
jgi:SAM-dependent methyltransferase